MAGGLPFLPPDATGPGGPPPGPAPSPMSTMSAMRPPSPDGGGGMGDKMMTFLAGLGFKQFAEVMKKLKGDQGDKKKTQAGGLIQNLAASRALPQNAMTPGGSPGMPPMLAGGQPPGLIALLAQLAAATQGKGDQ